MKALVTGGAGFIGSHLVERLINSGWETVVLDDLRKGRRENIQEFFESGRLLLEIGDIRDRAILERVMRHGPFDTVFHLAAMHYIPECVAHPVETLSVNLIGTQELLNGVECRRFVFASTADVYAPKEGPLNELDPVAPSNVYGLSKASSEVLLNLATSGGRNTSYFVARLFNVYGFRETNPHIIPRLIAEIKFGEVVRLGNLWPSRDFTFIEDTVDGLFSLSTLDESHSGGVFNIGSGVTTSVGDLVKLLGRILRTTLKIELDPSRVRTVDRAHLQADVSKLRQTTGWEPKHSLEEGLRSLCRSEGISD